MAERPYFSILHTTARPSWAHAYNLWMRRSTERAEYVLAVDKRWGFDHLPRLPLSGELGKVVWNDGRKCMVDGYAACAKAATGKVLILASDDIEPPEYWDALLRSVIGSRDPDVEDFVVHVRTGHFDGPMASSIQIMSRARYKRLGYVMFPEYESVYADDDFLEHAYAEEVVLDGTHLEPFAHVHSGPSDPVYRHQNRKESYALGASIIQRRRSDNYGASLAGQVVLFCPVREKHQIFGQVMRTHRALQGVMRRWYVDDNEDPSSSHLLLPEVQLMGHIKDSNGATPEAHKWDRGSCARMGWIRDAALGILMRTDAAAMLMVDADILLPPDLATHLMNLDQLIVSEVFWSKWNPSDPYLPNVWDFHPYGFTSAQQILRLREPGLYRVHGLGACTLIRREAVERGAGYLQVPGVELSGEDRHFAIRAESAGVAMWGDTQCTPFHVYRDAQLPEAVRWYDSGAPSDYFATNWLDTDWEAAISDRPMVPARAAQESPVIAVCLPGEHFSSAWVSHTITLLLELQARGYRIAWNMAYSSNVYITRQCLLESVMRTTPDPTYVLWLDDDNLLTGDQLQLLMEDLEAHTDLDGVCGWTWVQADAYGAPACPSCGMLNPAGETEPLQVEELANAKGLLGIEYSGFPVFLMRYGSLANFVLEHKRPFAPLISDQYAYGFAGEDVAFCQRAKDSGLHFAVDPRVHVPHLKLRPAQPVITLPQGGSNSKAEVPQCATA